MILATFHVFYNQGDLGGFVQEPPRLFFMTTLLCGLFLRLWQVLTVLVILATFDVLSMISSALDFYFTPQTLNPKP